METQNIEAFLKNRHVKRGLILIGAFLVVYLWVASWLSKIHLTEQKIQQFWAILKENTDRRVDMLPNFVQLVQDHAPEAQDVLHGLTKSYVDAKNFKVPDDQILNSAQAAQTFAHNQQQISDALSLMKKQAPLFPSLEQNKQFAMLTTYVITLEQQIDFSVKALEQQIKYYNFQITTFPQNLANLIYRFKPKYQVNFSTPAQ